MIYITGDTHGNIDFLRLKKYFKHRYVTDEDYLIILGDAGIVWSEKEIYMNEYSSLGLTVLFIDGNHENFELLNKFPIVDFKGARCHRLYNNLYHILRGEILSINGLSFFCMGGATSIDKAYRLNRISWWEEENISNKDILNGLDNLDKVNYQVDYVLSHAAPSFVVKKMFNYQIDSNTEILEKFQSQIKYNYWYFGHYHENEKWQKYRCFYSDILEIRKCNNSKDIKYPVLFLNEGKLYNAKTRRATKLKVGELPEWYYESSGWFYSLKDVSDVAFRRCLTNNHLDKDALVFLHYHGKLKKDNCLEPLNQDDWDADIWRGYAKDICLGLEKYSPHLNLDKLKAAINLNYDQYNQQKQTDLVVRPFPEINTPHYVDRWNNETAKYVVLYGDTVLSEFIKLDRAIAYAEDYISSKLRINIYQEAIGGESSDFIRAFDTSKEWIYVKRIK